MRRQTCDLVALVRAAEHLAHYFMFMEVRWQGGWQGAGGALPHFWQRECAPAHGIRPRGVRLRVPTSAPLFLPLHL